MRLKELPWLGLILIAAAWRAIYAYWTPLVNRYVVPPGDDGPFHIARVADILTDKWSLFYNGYPLGFHNLTALVARLTGWDALTAVRLVGPALLVLPVPVLYWVGRQLFKSSVAGAFASLTWAFLALGPVRLYANGNYPDLLAGSVIVPLALLFLVEVFRTWEKRAAWLAAGSFAAIPFFHHLSVVYYLTGALSLLAWESFLGLTHRATRRTTLKLLIGGISTVVLLTFIFWSYYGPSLILPFWETLRTEGTLERYFGSLSRPISLAELIELNNPAFILAGLTGLVAVLVSKTDRAVKVLLLGWVAILWFLSMTPLFGQPGRFVRELSVPLALTAGYQVSLFFNGAKTSLGKAVVIIVALGLIVLDWRASFDRPFALPDPYRPIVRVHQEEEPAFPVLERVTPENGVILANNSNFYLPFLVKRRVIIVTDPGQVDAILAAEPVTTIYVGARSALTPEDVYTMFAQFEEIKQKLLAIKDKERVLLLPTDSQVYVLKGRR